MLLQTKTSSKTCYLQHNVIIVVIRLIQNNKKEVMYANTHKSLLISLFAKVICVIEYTSSRSKRISSIYLCIYTLLSIVLQMYKSSLYCIKLNTKTYTRTVFLLCEKLVFFL